MRVEDNSKISIIHKMYVSIEPIYNIVRTIFTKFSSRRLSFERCKPFFLLVRKIFRNAFAMPFVLQWLIVPYTVIGSTLIAFGSNLLLKIFGSDKLGVWSNLQLAGVLFILSAILTYTIAVTVQVFDQFCSKNLENNAGTNYRIDLFYDKRWKIKRVVTGVLSWIILVIIVCAFFFLFSSYNNAMIPQQSQVTY